ncbi:hypothetical protein M5D96_007621, partial [Drosophila gunungcola]
MDTGVDAGILVGTAQSPGHDAAELVVEDGPATGVAGAAVPATGTGTEAGSREGVPVLVGPLAHLLLKQLDANGAQLIRGTGVAV